MLLLAATLGALMFDCAHGQTNWIGGIDGDWNVGANWDFGIPDTSTDAFVPGDPVDIPTVRINGSFEASALSLNLEGGNLSINADTAYRKTLTIAATAMDGDGVIVGDAAGSMAGFSLTKGTVDIANADLRLARNDSMAMLTVGGFGSGSMANMNAKDLVFDSGEGMAFIGQTGSVSVTNVRSASSVVGPGTSSLNVNGSLNVSGDLNTTKLFEFVVGEPTAGGNVTAATATLGDGRIKGSLSVGTLTFAESSMMEIGTGGLVANAAQVNVRGEVQVTHGEMSSITNLNVMDGGMLQLGSSSSGVLAKVQTQNLTVGDADPLTSGFASVTVGPGDFQVAGQTTILSTAGISVTGDQGTATFSTDDLVIQGGSISASFGGVIDISGDIDLSSGGRILVDDTSTLNVSALNFESGVLEASGNINGAVNQTGGTLAPGESPGAFTVNGDYNLDSSASVEIEIAGLTPVSQFDVLNVTGNSVLNGIFDVNLLGGFAPQQGDSFDIFNGMIDASSSYTFDFADAQLASGLQWNTSQFGSTGVLSVSAVPEPSSWLLGLGATLLATRARRGRLNAS